MFACCFFHAVFVLLSCCVRSAFLLRSSCAYYIRTVCATCMNVHVYGASYGWTEQSVYSTKGK